MSRARWVLLGALAVATPKRAYAAPPSASETSPATITVQGRVREAGRSRAPVSGAVVMLVDAPADVRPGKPAREPLDPEAVTWMLRAETDEDGRFTIPDVPIGTVRVVVVAGGYARLEQFERSDDGAIEIYLERERDGAYRTEVVTERREDPLEVAPDHSLDAQAARHYPGSGDDPLLAAMNLPGLARSPGGLGMLAFRGADPTEVGVYLDGHPIPRAFHVIPIAAMLAPPLVARLEISPGNYAANYGGFGGGLVMIDSRAGGREGIHGQAHIDLFDAGATIEGAVGKGSINLGVRRSHAGDLLRLVPLPQLTAPNFWDYFARFDYPLAGGHTVGVRALGAGDRLLLDDYFDLRANFHRFDFDYRFDNRRWQVLVSPSIRLDASTLDNTFLMRRHARVSSGRVAARWQPRDWIALDFGADVVVETWQRHQTYKVDEYYGVLMGNHKRYHGEQMRFGAWFSVPLRLGDWSVIPSVRANVFAYSDKPLFRIDPRLSLKGPFSGAVQLLAAAGMYAIPVFGARDQPTLSYFNHHQQADGKSEVAAGLADVPEYLFTYFDPGVGSEIVKYYVSATHVSHASLGFESALPWDLHLRALGFWRGSRTVEFERRQPFSWDDPEPRDYGRRASAGMELLLRRTLGRIDGWLGYTLMWALVDDPEHGWLPAIFDQRHNFVALISFALPRNFASACAFGWARATPRRR